uniref:Uncharacterized protein n=1 Tax=Anguilla anguilla TaxID=7936 RepID=A0A0E9SSS0_ANGAN
MPILQIILVDRYYTLYRNYFSYIKKMYTKCFTS